MRLGQDEDVAANLVTQIRNRVFDDKEKAKVTPADLKADTKIKYGTLDWDNNLDDLGDQTPVKFGGLYDEWGWEFACEAQRRIHMIRFGTFSTKTGLITLPLEMDIPPFSLFHITHYKQIVT